MHRKKHGSNEVHTVILSSEFAGLSLWVYISSQLQWPVHTGMCLKTDFLCCCFFGYRIIHRTPSRKRNSPDLTRCFKLLLIPHDTSGITKKHSFLRLRRIWPATTYIYVYKYIYIYIYIFFFFSSLQLSIKVFWRSKWGESYFYEADALLYIRF